MTEKQSILLEVPSINADRLQALPDLFPEAFSERQVDFEKLRASPGDLVDESPERYSFSWAGKRAALGDPGGPAFVNPSRPDDQDEQDAEDYPKDEPVCHHPPPGRGGLAIREAWRNLPEIKRALTSPQPGL